jgi:hypothetical protein
MEHDEIPLGIFDGRSVLVEDYRVIIDLFDHGGFG